MKPLIGIVAISLLIVLANSFYQVKETEQAIITQFGLSLIHI